MPQTGHGLVEQGGDVLLQDVPEHDLDVFAARERLGEDGPQRAVELHADDLPGAFGQLAREAADAGADLQHAGLPVEPGGLCDILRHPGGGQEVLPQGFGEAKAVFFQQGADLFVIGQIHFFSFKIFSKACRCGSCPGSASTRMLPR